MPPNSEFNALLLLPEEYMRNLGQVARINATSITVVKRKWVSKAGWELVEYPLIDCERVTYKAERPIHRLVFGGLLVALVIFVFVMVGIYWDDLAAETKIPVGALAIAGIVGLKWLVGARRHRLTFIMRDGRRLVFKSRAGEFDAVSNPVNRIVDFARSKGLVHE